MLAQIGQPCELTFTAVDGRAFDVRAHRGKPVVVVFFQVQNETTGAATSVSSQLAALEAAFGPDRIVIAGVSLDAADTNVRQLLDERHIGWPVQFDGRGWSTPLAQREMINRIPAYLLIDAQGRLVARGYYVHRLAARVKALLAAQPTEPNT